MEEKNTNPIDFVIIWVDGNDKQWQEEKAKYDGKTVTNANSEVRFRDWDNLQYWFRGVEKFAPLSPGDICRSGLIQQTQNLTL